MDACVLVVNEDGEFSSTFSDNISHVISNINGCSYRVISILGCQAGGKSTLLNKMFGTNFKEMNCKLGRTQTTKGICVSKDLEHNILVFDVEGTDSCERGENRLTFEHRASLFSLAVSDIVIINLWYTDIGRYTASNYGLLKTVLEVNLDIFKDQAKNYKTTLLFFIRDWQAEYTPLEILQNYINADIKNIWSVVTERSDYVSFDYNDFFVIKIVALCSYVLDKNKFINDLKEYKNKYIIPKPDETYSRAIPIDGFAYYVESVWNTIQQNRDLDIPSQKYMVSIYRCGNIETTLFTNLKQELNETKLDLTNWPNNLIKEKINEYYKQLKQNTSKYDSKIYEETKKHFIELCTSHCQTLFDVYWNKNKENIIAEYKNNFVAAHIHDENDEIILPEEISLESAWIKLHDKLLKIKNNSLKSLEDTFSAYSFLIDENNKITIKTADYIQYAAKKLDVFLTAILNKEKEHFKKYMKSAYVQLYNILVSNYLVEDLTKYWEVVTPILCVSIKEITRSKLDSYIALHSADTNNKYMFYVLLFNGLHEYLQTHVDELSNYVLKRFKVFFNKDTNSFEHQVKTASIKQIKKIFDDSKSKAYELWPIISIFNPDVDIINNKLSSHLELNKIVCIIIDDININELKNRINNSITIIGQSAQLQHSNQKKNAYIPALMWILLLILGWNELLYIIKSPFIITFLLILSVIALLLYSSGFISEFYSMISTVILKLFNSVYKSAGLTFTSKTIDDDSSIIN